MNTARREPGRTTFALGSTSVLLAAVIVLSIRYQSDSVEDSGLAAMFIMGVLLFVIPTGLAIYLLSRTSRAQVAAVVVTIISSLLIATRRIGNLAALWYPLIALGAIIVLVAWERYSEWHTRHARRQSCRQASEG